MGEPYVHPEVLVSADWVEEHRNDPKVRIVESDEDVLLYDMGHVPGAVKIDWQGDLQDQIIRDYINAEKFAAICARSGIANDTTVVFYGDKSNWWACYAFWAFKLFGHKDCRVMDGGRQLWIAQKRPLSTDVPQYPATHYKVEPGNEETIRVFRDAVMDHSKSGKPLLDVRSPKEFTGEKTHMEDYPQEGSLRGGHIPGAVSVPWSRAVNEDGTFKTADELKAIYESEVGLKPTDDVVAYCRIGERSSLTWFVLTYLLGYSKVRNYDGSWCEWGNLVRAPIAKGA
ncbi:sulfurtransferase [Singulisphaera acidiphila]|uniref:Sulfurtransferase n=1 Tax=Singulisphaera acidiphila (strain ATCC BAA-1392 / DSM 18658 / VKM B-2454 / MOB10) TaxID=886293 RepID=L0DJL4_SINAD|nr:sulfurtransferase [Singulisphaera acidiphila]AGA29437.1 rhodanese-related sulfurtransferase [Singulisphaera acidiphila DSM 18658]